MNRVTLGTLNIQGVGTKWKTVEELFSVYNMDVVVLTETWLRRGDRIYSEHVVYSTIQERTTGEIARGIGGITILARKELKEQIKIVKGNDRANTVWLL